MKDLKMYARKYGNEPADLKLMFIFFVRNFRYVIYSAIAGCIVFALSYYLFQFVLTDEEQYVAQAELYIEYATDVRLDNIYINDYTWQNLVHTDRAIDYVREKISYSMTDEELKACVTANLVSDVRFVTLKVTAKDPGQAVNIARYFQEAIILFTEDMVDVENVVVFTNADHAEEIVKENKTLNMAIAGTVTGIVLAVFMILFCYTFDDATYIPLTFERRFGVPVIGVFHGHTEKELRGLVMSDENIETKKGGKHDYLTIKIAKRNLRKCAEGCMNIAVTDISIKPASERAFETLLHLKLLNEQEEMTEIAKGDLAEEDACFSAPNFRLDSKDAFKENADVAAECAKYDGTILLVRAGEHNAQVVERAINFLKKQGCNIIGVQLYDADAWILRFYYYRPVSFLNRKDKAIEDDTEEQDFDVEDISARRENS